MQLDHVDRPSGRHLVYRHRLPVRILHWLVVLSFALLLMSGLQIFNAHPALYWGVKSDFGHPLLAMKTANTLRSSGRME